MNKDAQEAFAAWGDRANRDTAHLMDIVAAGVIDQLLGHGTVVLRPHRLEEIVSRIAMRERDEDGGWRITLLPDPDDKRQPVNTEQSSEEMASLAGRVLAAGNPLENEQVLAVILNSWSGPGAPEVRDCIKRDMLSVLQPYFDNMLRLAGSVLTQRG